MSGLSLDARQRAMLEEMGVRVWWPTAPAAPAPAVPSEPAAPAAREAPVDAAPRAPQAPPPSRAAAAAAAVPPTHAPAPAGAATVLADPPRRLDAGPLPAATPGGWLVVADMPPEADGRHAEPLAQEGGRLLTRMLQALRLLDGPRPVHLLRLHRGVASGREHSPAPLPPVLDAALRTFAPAGVLALGPLSAQSLAGSSQPLGRLRGQVLALQGPAGTLPLVVSYHPAYLLRNPQDKARAWADLCLAAEHFGHPPS